MADAQPRYRTGQVAAATLLTVTSFVGAVVAPILYVGNIKEKVAVEDARITTVEQDIHELKDNVEYIRRSQEEQNRQFGIKIKEE